MTRARWWIFLLLSQFGFPYQAEVAPGGDPGGPVYRVGDGVLPPRILRKTDPHYTSEARRNVIQGTVVLEVLVDERGNLARASILSPLGFGLDERAREA